MTVEPFKNLINPTLVRGLAKHLATHGAPAATFLKHALPGLEDLELKARGEHVAAALSQVLPADFAQAAPILEAVAQELSGFIVWPITMYVANHGGSDPKRALAALRAITPRFTSEFAIRTFVRDQPALTFATLKRWLRDPNEHVRRLVSEGTRPRLPWGMRLTALVADPAPSLPLLVALRDDESEYVRRSVANHLNDIAKDHPSLFADLLDEWMQDAPDSRVRLLRHASRTLIKAGDPRVLQAFGVHQELEGSATFRIAPRRIELGQSIALSLALVSTGKSTQKLAVDYVVHHRKKAGGTSPKVFKGWVVSLAPGEARTLTRNHAVRPITTRTYYPGEHTIECRINGRAVGTARFTLSLP